MVRISDMTARHSGSEGDGRCAAFAQRVHLGIACAIDDELRVVPRPDLRLGPPIEFLDQALWLTAGLAQHVAQETGMDEPDRETSPC